MKKSRLTEEVFKMRFEEVYGHYNRGQISCEEAANLLGISIKTFYRKRQRHEGEDFGGLFDRRVGKRSSNRASDAEIEFLTRLYEERYKMFSVKHFYEFAKREHGVKRSYGWTKNKLIEKGLVSKSNRGGKHRLRRERKAMAGMMIHQDGSKHRWLLALDYDLDLIVTLDDATSKITSCFLVEEEGTASTFRGLHETIQNEGLFCSFYTDRGSHYFETPEAGGKVDKNVLTQVGRALKQLGIKHIAAYSPQARGRSERMFGTLQARLPQEFALYNIATKEEANRYLREVYMPRHNEQFCVKPKCEESAFVRWKASTMPLKDLLCVQEDRVVQCDNTVRYNKLILQIPKNEHRPHYMKAEVKVHQYTDGKLAIFYGHLCIGRYDAKGKLITGKAAAKRENKGAKTSARFPWETPVGLRPPYVSNGKQNFANCIK
jgi:transposase